MPQTIHLVIIDPQNDFCHPDGSLFVPGADEDMTRLAAMVDRLSGKLDDIHATLDSHRLVDIAQPLWFKDADGAHPAPFTIIGADDVKNGTWRTTVPSFRGRTVEYLEALAATKRYPHCIWPPHCLIGSWGHNIVTDLYNALQRWEEKRFAMVAYAPKGSNPWTEHFSGVQAEVPDPEDPTTQLNTTLINILEETDIVLVAGEALSHCLANTVRDIASGFSDPKYVQKIHLLTDASSSVPGFENLGDAFLKEMVGQGMQTTTTTEFLR